MSVAPATAQTPLQRFASEQALILAEHLEEALQQAPEGQTLRDAEALVLAQGRVFLQRLLGEGLQQKIDAAQKKGQPSEPVRADRSVATRAPIPERS